MTDTDRLHQMTLPARVEARLFQLEADLDRAGKELDEAEARYLDAKADLEVARARAYLTCDGKNADERRSKAVLQCEEALRALAVAEALVKSSREAIRRIYTQIDIARSVGVLARAGMNL